MTISLLLFAVVSVEIDPIDDARNAIQFGMELRQDRSSARPWFRSAGDQLDTTTTRHDRRIALKRLKCYYLCDDIGMSLVACHEGLMGHPADPELNRELAFLRSQTRAREYFSRSWWLCAFPRSFWFYWLSIAFAVRCVARLVLRYHGRDVIKLANGFLLLAIIGTMAQITIEYLNNQDRLGIVLSDAVLRAGNGDAYPSRLADPLPTGSELRCLHERGDWVQVETPSRVVGWIPQEQIRWIQHP